MEDAGQGCIDHLSDCNLTSGGTTVEGAGQACIDHLSDCNLTFGGTTMEALVKAA